MYSFKASAGIASGHMTIACAYTASALSYQHIHPPIQFHRTVLASTKYQIYGCAYFSITLYNVT
jgi:hypothetical protein